MQYRLDTKTGNKLSVLGFGCMRFHKEHGTIDQPQVDKLIHTAIDYGINYFDTAYVYSGSEIALGKALASGKRENVYIADKLPAYLCKNGAQFNKYWETQLTRLQTDYIDYYLIHMLSDMDRWQRLCSYGIEEWIASLKKSGRITSIGFSFHGSQDEFMKLLDAYDWDFCQIQYNYMDEYNQAGKAGLQKAAAKGIPVMIMEPLLGGRLANNLPSKAIEVFQTADPSRTPAAWGLRWVLDQPEVTLLLSGMNELSQLEENCNIAKTASPGHLTEKDYAAYREVKSIFSQNFKVPCTGCGYCMPCPHGVDIPTCFSAYNAKHGIDHSTGTNQYLLATGGITPNPHYASLCKNCGKCVKHCPQSIAIPDVLKDVAKTLEPFWFRPTLAIARKIMRLNK